MTGTAVLGRRTLATLTKSGSEQGDSRYIYDGLSRLTRESQEIKEGTTRNVDYVYDRAGNRLTLTYPQTKNVAYTYDGKQTRKAQGPNGTAYQRKNPGERATLKP